DLGTTVNVEYEHLFGNFMYNYGRCSVSEKTMGKFQLILDYLDKNFTDSGLTLTTLSEISSLSECYISELFTIILGIKFKQHLNTLRINYALRLLSMSDVTISGAAYESGFETIRTFNSAFKRLKGVTPSEYLDGVKGKDTGAGIVTGIKNLRAESVDKSVSYFPGGCDIRILDDPCGKRGKVFGLYANTKNKAWTTFNVGMLFKAGKTYRVSFDVYPLDDADGNDCTSNTIGTNLFYPEGDGEARAHAGCGVSASTGDGWLHCESDMQVSEAYVPGLYDKFSIFGNPANDVGINFLLDNICCYLIE
ncbi:MAG: helix-turn-helix transcriptional regulator, partial [Clostridia bacterium]|nr:helix-turn-helix transcriptional regulator [Clostridia bacterium]